MSDRFRLIMLIILTILTVIWALVWRFTVSVLVGIAVFYFLPPQHETYTPSSKINAQFSVPVLKNENGECVLKRWTEFDSVQDKICTQSFEDISCFPIPQTKTGCDLKQINTQEYKFIAYGTDQTETNHYRLTEGCIEPLSFTWDSFSRRLVAGLIAAGITLLLTLALLLHPRWGGRIDNWAAAKKAKMAAQHKD